jgi:hypothetical protein
MVVGTNAPTGYTLTYNGATLTHSNTIDTIPGADINADADGTSGTSQFALAGTETGGGAMVAGYDATVPNWDFIPATVSSIATSLLHKPQVTTLPALIMLSLEISNR